MGKLQFLALLLSVSMPAGLATSAFADGDYDKARDLYAHGDIQGLGDVLRRAATATPGEVVDIDLVERNGVWVYRLAILGEDGHRRIVEMNANRDGDGDAPGGSAAR